MQATALSTNQLVTFQLENDLFGIDIMITQEILKMTQLRRVPNSPFYFEGMLNLRGDVIPIINFKKLFHFGTFELSRDKGIIIVNIESQRFGIVIDKVLRVFSIEKISINPVPEGFPKPIKQYLIGVIKDQTDHIAILDIKSIFQMVANDLALGDISYYNLDFRRDKLSNNLEEEKIILNFLKSINFNINSITNIGIFNYFSKQKIINKTTMNVVVKQVKDSIENGSLTLLNKEKNEYFFDHSEDYYAFFDLFDHVIVPRKLKENNKNIKILNIGCGKGYELYSILFLLKSFVPDFEKWNVKLMGIDDNFNNLTFANEGLYPVKSLIKINKNDSQKYFVTEEGNYRIKKDLKERVSFRFATPKNFESIRGVDLIFCRNVLSKMDDTSINRVISEISESLNQYGVLLLSEIEDLYNIEQNLLSAREINGHRYYVRQ